MPTPIVPASAPKDMVDLRPGSRIRVTQQIVKGDGVWTTAVEGVVVKFGQAKTGSWFAHAKGNQLWLDRVELRRADGEIVVCSLDQLSRVEVLEAAPAEGGSAAGSSPAAEGSDGGA